MNPSRFALLAVVSLSFSLSCQQASSPPANPAPVLARPPSSTDSSTPGPEGAKAVVLQIGLPEAIAGSSLSPDGALLAVSAGPTGTQTGAICVTKLWDVRSGQLRGVLPACSRPLAWSPDSAAIVMDMRLMDLRQGGRVHKLREESASPFTWVGWEPNGARLAFLDDKGIELWDRASSKLQMTLKTDKPARHAKWTPAGAPLGLASISHDGNRITIWNVARGTESAVLDGVKGARFLEWNGDGALLLSAGEDATVKVWDRQRGKQIGSLEGHAAPVAFIAVAPDGIRAATASGSKSDPIRVWSIANGKQLAALESTEAVSGMDWNADGSILEVRRGAVLERWDVLTGTRRDVIAPPSGERGLGVSRDKARQLRVQAYGNVAQLWDTRENLLLKTIRTTDDSYRVFDGVVDSSGTRFAWPAASAVLLWDLPRGATVGLAQESSGTLRHAEWSPDGASVLTATDKGVVKLWDTTTGAMRAGIAEPAPLDPNAATWGRTFSPSSAMVVTPKQGSSKNDTALAVWDARSGALLSSVPGATGGTFSPDGKRLGLIQQAPVWDPTGSTGEEQYMRVKMWDLTRQKMLWSLDWTYVSAGFNHDGRLFATTPHDINEPAKVNVLDATTGKIVAALPGCVFMANHAAAWHPREGKLAHVTTCGLSVWDGAKETTLTAPNPQAEELVKGPQAVAWSPDGALLASSHGLFDGSSGAKLPGLEPDTDPDRFIRSIDWSQDGKLMAVHLAGFSAELWSRSGKRLARIDDVDTYWWMAGGRILALRRMDSHEPLQLYRVSDGAVLHVATLKTDSRVGGVVYDDDGFFDGDDGVLSMLFVRVGEDMRSAPLVGSGSVWERQRKRGMLAGFVAEPADKAKSSPSASGSSR